MEGVVLFHRDKKLKFLKETSKIVLYFRQVGYIICTIQESEKVTVYESSGRRRPFISPSLRSFLDQTIVIWRGEAYAL